MPHLQETPTIIVLTDDERDAGSMSDYKLYDAVEAFFNDGFVVLENAVRHELIDGLNSRMAEDTTKLLSGQGLSHYASGKTGRQPVATSRKFHLSKKVYANKNAARIIANALGPLPEVHFLRSNTLLNTDDRQRVHSDMRFEHPTHAFAITQNVCLCDMGPENGVTELWLGTQNTGTEVRPQLGEPFIDQAEVERRRVVRPPIYPRIKKGSILIRDLRLWHAGMPNPTDQARILLTINYYAGWFKNGALIPLPLSLKSHFEDMAQDAGIRFAAEWVADENYDYLESKFSNNFSSVLHPEVWAKIAHVKTAKGY